eukprot:TRINITY_DN15196_c0_g1_i1.p1 TRINITY_DN15196_c0_g1~~TRINITY_DN15196_c0_g1_i1.p1  ORF type:complete len:192 (+),score=26.29 TRINITY_DN15196_c0_g1_i1:42-617(+)
MWLLKGLKSIRSTATKEGKVMRRLDDSVLSFVKYILTPNEKKLSPAEIMHQDLRKYNDDYNQSYFFGYHSIFVKDPASISKIFSDTETFRKVNTIELQQQFMGDSVFVSEGTKWKHQRKIINPAFAYKWIMNLTPLITERAENLCKDLQDSAKDKQYISIYLPMRRFTLVSSLSSSTVSYTHLTLPTKRIV